MSTANRVLYPLRNLGKWWSLTWKNNATSLCIDSSHIYVYIYKNIQGKNIWFPAILMSSPWKLSLSLGQVGLAPLEERRSCWVPNIWVCIYIYICIHVCIYIYICICIYIYVCIYAYIYIYMYVCMHSRVCICLYYAFVCSLPITASFVMILYKTRLNIGSSRRVLPRSSSDKWSGLDSLWRHVMFFQAFLRVSWISVTLLLQSAGQCFYPQRMVGNAPVLLV